MHLAPPALHTRPTTLFPVPTLSRSSLITEMGPRLSHIDYLHPAFAAIAGGLLMGSGLLFLARHRSSLGGATIASLYLQDRYGSRAGKVQMAIDCCGGLAALRVVPFGGGGEEGGWGREGGGG